MATKNVSVDSLFDIVRGKTRYTRDYAREHPGKYPVYSASLAGPMTHIDTYDHRGPLLVFTNNGYAGSVRIITGKFSLSRDCCALVPREDVLIPDLQYLRRVIESTIRPLAVGRRVEGLKNEYTKLTREMVAEAQFPVLITGSNVLDYQGMREAGLRIQRVDSLQRNLSARSAAIKDSVVVVECDEPFETVYLSDDKLFELSIGRRVLKSEVVDTGVPVYSANVRIPFGKVASSRLQDVSQPSLLWGIDGNFDWNLIPPKQDFVPTDHCGRLQVKDPLIDPTYLLYELRATREEYGFDRVYRASLKNILQVKARIPLDEDGHYSLERQRELADRHRSIEALRAKALETLDAVARPSVSPTA